MTDELKSNLSKCVKCDGEVKDTFFHYSSCTCGGFYVPLREYGIAKQRYVSMRQSLLS